MARIIVHELLSQYTTGHPEVPIRAWVDDLVQFCKGPYRSVLNVAALAVRQLLVGLRQLGFRVSKKSLLLASHASLASAISAIFHQQANVSIRTVDAVVDLGVDTSATRRSTSKAVKRELLADRKVQRVRKLHLKKHRAKVYRAS